MNVRCFWLFLLLLFGAASAQSQSVQKQTTHQQLWWLAYTNTLEFKPNWSLTTEVHERRYFNPDAQHQFVLRTNLRRKLVGNWEGSAGFTYFLQSPHDPRAVERLTIPELRPHIQFNYNQPLGRLTVTHRYRAEKRFFRNTANGQLADGYNTNYRFRYRLGADYHFADLNEQPLKLRVYNELFVNAGQQITYNRFDQNRLYGGLNYSVSKSLNVEAGYMNWYQQQRTGHEFYNRHIISFIINHRFSLAKQKQEAGS